MEEKGISHSKYFKNNQSLGDYIQSTDWSDHSLGPTSDWPAGLHTTLSIMSDSKLPMMLFWGSNHFCFFNRAYMPFLRTNSDPLHDVGEKGEIIYKNSWESVKSRIDQVQNEAKTIWSEQVNKNIITKYEYSPVKDQSSGVGGVLVIC